MNRIQTLPMLQALMAAGLFGASAPVAKLLLGQIEPVVLAALLYLGSGLGLLLFKFLERIWRQDDTAEARITGSDTPWLLGAILAGGVFAPIILMFSLQATPASTASLLLNFEVAATALIAYLFFKEAVGWRIWTAIALITTASVIISWHPGDAWGVSLGAVGIVTACLLWGLDNNFTRMISAKDPFMIVTVKGLAAGSFSLFLAAALDNRMPAYPILFLALLVGCLCYGLSIILFILAMRRLGAARTCAFYGTAPFAGALISFILLGEIPGSPFLTALPLMIAGTALMLSEDHCHQHCHAPVNHDHHHQHDDGHHQHPHQDTPPLVSGCHAHAHSHGATEHSHRHTPDIHHRHPH